MTSIKYPIIGYAPGSYYCRCATCGDQFTGDKLAVQCHPCAINTLSESHSLSLERIGELEKEVERLMGVIGSNYKTWHKQFYRATSNLTAREIEDFFTEKYAEFKKENNL